MVELLREITRPKLHRGLEDVLVDWTELSRVNGDAGELLYRGYPIESLATDATFEEILYLLWYGELPDRESLDDFSEQLTVERSIDDDLLELLRMLAAAGEKPMFALRTAVSMLSASDPDSGAEPEDLDATLRKGRRITATIPTILAAFDRFRRGRDPIEPRTDLDYGANFLYMLEGTEPTESAAETFDMALTLHADHGLNASTFTTLVIVSTYADVYSGVTGGIGALSGPWHGGANQDVMRVLVEIDESDTDPIAWVRDALENGRRIPGWGHRVYTVKDPRANILEDRSRILADETGESKWHEYTTTIEQYLTDDVGLPEKGIAPNVDFYSGPVYDQLGIAIDLYTPIFAMSRVGGWVGHVLEYQTDNRLIRPRAQYVGPERRAVVPLEDR